MAGRNGGWRTLGDGHYGSRRRLVRGLGRWWATRRRYISVVSTCAAGRGGTYGRVAEGREGRTAVGGMFKVTVRRDMQAVLWLWAEVDLHGFGNNYNLRQRRAGRAMSAPAGGGSSQKRPPAICTARQSIGCRCGFLGIYRAAVDASGRLAPGGRQVAASASKLHYTAGGCARLAERARGRRRQWVRMLAGRRTRADRLRWSSRGRWQHW